LFLKSFFHPNTGDVSLVNYKKFFDTPYYFNTLKRSLLVSTVTTVLAVLLGVPIAYITSRYNVWGKPVINVMIILSMLSPPFIGAYSWILLLGRNGFITNLMEKIGIAMPAIYGFYGMVLVFTLKLFPYVYLYVSGALGSIDSSLEEAAESLGMNKFRRMLTVTFPVIMPTISAAALVVFMTSMADFGTPLLIGEGYKVLPVVVYEEYMSDIGGDTIIASTLSTIIVLCAVVVLFLQKAYVSRRNYRMSFLSWPGARSSLPSMCWTGRAGCPSAPTSCQPCTIPSPRRAGASSASRMKTVLGRRCTPIATRRRAAGLRRSA
jgi:iron(III) transport system permease protein